MDAVQTIRTEHAKARTTALEAARKAFLETGKPSLSIRRRAVLPRDDLDERLVAALNAYCDA